MTIEEKLEKATAFIKSLESMHVYRVDVNDFVTVKCECPECGADDIDVSVKTRDDLVLASDMEKIKDDAWHVLVDLTD